MAQLDAANQLRVREQGADRLRGVLRARRCAAQGATITVCPSSGLGQSIYVPPPPPPPTHTKTKTPPATTHPTSPAPHPTKPNHPTPTGKPTKPPH